MKELSPIVEHGLVHQWLEQQAELHPHRTALRFGLNEMTYKGLNERANQIAHALLQQGLPHQSPIGILVPRGMNMIIAKLGVLKAGLSYVPMDPELPPSRIAYMMVNSRTRLLITEQALLNSQIQISGPFMLIDDADYYAECPKQNLPPLAAEDDLAYVIYTSGSTGNPKGVMISHRSVNNFMLGIAERIDLKDIQTVLCVTTISFDIFVLEALLPLAYGKTVIIADENQQQNPAKLSRLIDDNQIDLVQMTPSRLHLLLLHEKSAACLAQVKIVLIGGEPLQEPLLQAVQKRTNARIFNMYGPTETTIWSSIAELTASRRITIGIPIRQTAFYLLDEEGLPVQEGEIGHLCISGTGLAIGYIHNEILSNERFIYSRHVNERIYRTGDLAQRLANGEYVFVGRVDNQLKIRGYRVEIEEVEAHLTKIPSIKRAAVLAKKGETDNILISVVVSDEKLNAGDIRSELQKLLPDYMIPSSFFQVERVPLTPNGKVDRREIQNLVTARLEKEKQQAQRSSAKHRMFYQLIDIIGSIVDITRQEEIHIDTPLEDIGVDSINFIRMLVEIEREFQVIIGDEYLQFGAFSSIRAIIDYLEEHANQNEVG